MNDTLLETKNLHRFFGGLHAVKDISFREARGAIKAIIGPNGAGKTTLFNLIAGTIPPHEGAVYFQGKSISYFVLKIDNKVSSFLDACASCYTHKQGYRYENGSVTCRYCNMKFPISKLEKGLGGCYPIKIEGRLDKGNYFIPVETLEKMADKF
jgi:energy-coupling factor transporter ATP-binding protein EcfA2